MSTYKLKVDFECDLCEDACVYGSCKCTCSLELRINYNNRFYRIWNGETTEHHGGFSDNEFKALKQLIKMLEK
jgi:hypothetical protein